MERRQPLEATVTSRASADRLPPAPPPTLSAHLPLFPLFIAARSRRCGSKNPKQYVILSELDVQRASLDGAHKPHQNAVSSVEHSVQTLRMKGPGEASGSKPGFYVFFLLFLAVAVRRSFFPGAVRHPTSLQTFPKRRPLWTPWRCVGPSNSQRDCGLHGCWRIVSRTLCWGLIPIKEADYRRDLSLIFLSHCSFLSASPRSHRPSFSPC